MMVYHNKKNKIYYITYSLSTTISSDTLPHTHRKSKSLLSYFAMNDMYCIYILYISFYKSFKSLARSVTFTPSPVGLAGSHS